MSDKKTSSIDKIGEGIEFRTHNFIREVVNRLLDGLFLFKKRKGEMTAASATFFCLFSFGPILLLLISLAGFIFEDTAEAKNHVLLLVENNFPGLAKWIMVSISKIIDSQLKSSNFNLLNTGLLLYACLGVISSLIFGLNTIAKKESRGGFLIEDMKSLGIGTVISSFIFSLMVLSNKTLMIQWLSSDSETMNSLMGLIVGGNFLPSVMSLIFFTAFYKLASPVNIGWKDSLMGAGAFVSCFIAGKSFYWIYLLYSKGTMTQSYGSFYTLIIAAVWVYFLNCSFFYGAAVSYSEYQKNSKEINAPVPVLVPAHEEKKESA